MSENTISVVAGELQNEYGERVSESDLMERLWGLSYAQFLTVPRVVIQSMPTDWQDRLADLLQELDERQDWRPEEGCYHVQMNMTSEDEYERALEKDRAQKLKLVPVSQEDCNYRHGRRFLKPPPAPPTLGELDRLFKITGEREYRLGVTAKMMTAGLALLCQERARAQSEDFPDPHNANFGMDTSPVSLERLQTLTHLYDPWLEKSRLAAEVLRRRTEDWNYVEESLPEVDRNHRLYGEDKRYGFDGQPYVDVMFSVKKERSVRIGRFFCKFGQRRDTFFSNTGGRYEVTDVYSWKPIPVNSGPRF